MATQTWQGIITTKLNQLHQEAFEKHKPITEIIQELKHPKGADALNEVALAAKIAYGCTEDVGGTLKPRTS